MSCKSIILVLWIFLLHTVYSTNGVRLLDTSVSCDQANFVLSLNFDSQFKFFKDYYTPMRSTLTWLFLVSGVVYSELEQSKFRNGIQKYSSSFT
jgi:hypothetical protein